jgi:hypothetical protein
MICVACQAASCFQHDTPWHEGESCDEYNVSSFAQDFASSLTLISAETKACPRCSTRIYKEDGCEHVCYRSLILKMLCSAPFCNHEFCWMCLKDSETIDDEGHDPACPCFGNEEYQY